MKINKLKILSVTVCCVVTSFWAGIQGSEKESQIRKNPNSTNTYTQVNKEQFNNDKKNQQDNLNGDKINSQEAANLKKKNAAKARGSENSFPSTNK